MTIMIGMKQRFLKADNFPDDDLYSNLRVYFCTGTSMNASVKYLTSLGGSLPTLELVGIRMIITCAG